MSNITGDQAISIIAMFPKVIDNIAKVIAGTSLGPWTIAVSCSYDGGCKKEKYSARVELSTAPLVGVLGSAEAHSKTFTTNFQPVMVWLKNTLPSFSTTFNDSKKKILAVLNKAQASGKLTPAQKKTLAGQFEILQSGLSAGQKELEQGNAAMGVFVQAQEQFTSDVSAVQQNLEKDTQAALTKAIDFANGQHCGQGDARSQYNVIEKEYKSTVGVFDTEFSKFSSGTTTASNAVKALIGIVLDFSAQITKISQDLQKVEDGNLSIFIQKVTVMASSDMWSSLAKQAKQEFGNEVSSTSHTAMSY